MGYDLHITRREFHADEHGPDISAEEWLALVEADEDLALSVEDGPYFAKFLGECRYGRGMGWFDWCEGCVYTKNPDEAILAKMLELAGALDAKVQGDDGETYVKPDLEAGFVEPKVLSDKQSVFKDLLGCFRDLLFPPVAREELPFDVGDRVRDVFGKEGVVTAIDRRAERGLGKITVRYDDGRVLASAVAAHGLDKVMPASPDHKDMPE